MENYAKEIAQKITEMGYDARFMPVEKANGIMKNAVVVNNIGDSVGVTIYTDDMYRNNMTVDDAVMEAQKLFNANLDGGKKVADIINNITDYEWVKRNLTLRLYNKSTKADLFRSAKRYGFDDLILVPYISVESGSVKVKEEFLAKWGVDKNTVFKDALANLKKDVYEKTMADFLAGKMGMTASEMFGPFIDASLTNTLVLSNNDQMFGASAVIAKLPELKKRYEHGFYVIPSSVHEVIIVGKMTDNDESELSNMVGLVNNDCLQPEEILGTKAYAFV